MNPLSPFTYYIRHKSQALLLLALIGSLTLGVYTLVSLSSTLFKNIHYSAHYLSRMSRLSTGKAPSTAWLGQISAFGTVDPGVVAQIRAHPDVAAVLPENGLHVGVPVGLTFPFPVLGVQEADLPVVMDACNLRLKEGRSIEPRAAEIILSEELASALDLNIGDHLGYDINANYYSTMATELTLVGVLESVPSDAGPEVRTGFVSYEYLEAHELYRSRSTNWLIIPHPGSRAAVNDFATSLIAEGAGSSSMNLGTYESEMEYWQQSQRLIDAMYSFMDGLVAVAAALVVGMVHRIAITRRLPELGLLHAAGYHKRRLVRRLALEIAAVACGGWATGLLCAHAFAILLSSTYFAAQGVSTDLADPAPFLYTLPIPFIVVGWIYLSVNRTLNRLDPVAIIERGKLSMEETGGRKQEAAHSHATRSTHNPLSSWTFFLRHRRRSILLLAAIGLMVPGVTLPGFLAAILWDSTLAYFLSYTSHSAIIAPGYTYHAVPPDVVAQIKAHPAVAHTIPVKALSMVIDLPMIGEFASAPIYAVREQDLPILLDVYGLHLGEGELIRPRSNHVILTGALAQNRNLDVGDVIGHPVHERDGMPTEMTVVGLLESTNPELVERKGYNVPALPRWVGFASYEYVDGHERYAGTPTHLLVIPIKGRELEMETWLEETLASPRVEIETLDKSYRIWQQNVQTIQMTNAISTTLLTAAAALGLAILNTVFFTQRRDEFGILHAAGHDRVELVTRTLRESVSITFAAWLIGAASVLILLLGTQAAVYAPKGMSLDLTNVIPWLFTLPIPLATVTASAGTIAWALSRLDPVAVIERR
jgi:ABC-type lipoprotein release transport system permease subunit